MTPEDMQAGTTAVGAHPRAEADLHLGPYVSRVCGRRTIRGFTVSSPHLSTFRPRAFVDYDSSGPALRPSRCDQKAVIASGWVGCFHIKGMTCASCLRRRGALKATPGWFGAR
jgi:hypothetical protein